MVRLRFEHVLTCTPDRFWAGFLRPETISGFYTRGIGFTRFDILRLENDASSIRRAAACHLPVVLSRALQPLFQRGFSFIEDGVFERASRTWRYTWTPATLPSRINIDGWIRAEPIVGESGSCRRLAEIDVEAKIPVLGSLIERTAERLLRTSWDLSATILNEWLAQGIWM